MKEEDLGDDAAPLPPTKNARATRKAAAAKKVKDEDVEPDASVQAPEGNQPPPAKKTRAPRKAKTTKKIKDEETDNDDLSEDYESAPPVKKTRAPRKTAATKKIKAEEADEVPTVTKKTRAPRKKSATNHVEDQGENTAEASNGAAESSAEVPEVSSKAQVGEGPESEVEPEPETGASEAPVKPKKGGKKGGKKAVKKAAKGK